MKQKLKEIINVLLMIGIFAYMCVPDFLPREPMISMAADLKEITAIFLEYPTLFLLYGLAVGILFAPKPGLRRMLVMTVATAVVWIGENAIVYNILGKKMYSSQVPYAALQMVLYCNAAFIGFGIVVFFKKIVWPNIKYALEYGKMSPKAPKE